MQRGSASGNSICGVSAPTVLILAAGQGTRMRSKTPKVLHELCGLPMVLWPVRAALDAGAEQVVVVDSPAARARGGAAGGRAAGRAGAPERHRRRGGRGVAALERARASASPARW